MKLSIIVPAHNEQNTIGPLLEQLAVLDLDGWDREVIVVDDGSTDGTYEAARLRLGMFNGRGCMEIIRHEKNAGKGAAIKSALKKAGGGFVIIQDADGEYDPGEIPKLLSVISRAESQTAVFGNRGTRRYPERGWHYVAGAKLLTWTFNVLFGARIGDLYTGYKLIPADIFKLLNIQSAGFEFEAEVACKLLKKGVRILEVPIANYRPRSKRQGKHIRFKDAVMGLLAIIKYRVI